MSGVQHSVHTVSGRRVHVAEAGAANAGRTLFLVHGLGGPQMWQNVVAPLSEQFRVIVPDLPGFGDSAPPPGPYSTDDFAGFIGSLMDAMGVDRGSFAGISYGGELCALVASRAPRRVDRLVLIAPTGFDEPAWIALNDVRWAVASFCMKHTLLRSRTFLSFSGGRSFHDIRNRPAGFVEAFHRQLMPAENRDVFLQIVRNISSVRNGFPEELRRIASPTMIIWGNDDRVVPPGHGARYAENIPHATLRMLAECGHSVPLEKPAEMVRDVVQFLGDER